MPNSASVSSQIKKFSLLWRAYAEQYVYIVSNTRLQMLLASILFDELSQFSGVLSIWQVIEAVKA